MKVLVVSNFFSPYQLGGARQVAEATARGCQELGYTVVVLTGDRYRGLRSLWPRSSSENGVIIYRWYPLNLYFLADAAGHIFFTRLLWTALDNVNIFAWLAVRSVLRREKPDVIVSHNTKGLGGFIYRQLAKQTDKYIQVLHDVQLLEPSGLLFPDSLARQLSNFPHMIYQVWSRRLTATTPIVVAPSVWLLQLHRERGFFKTARTATILNPVRTELVTKINHDTFNVVYVGQLELHKGIDVLLQAWGAVSKINKRLIIAGEGQQYDLVMKAVSHDKTIIYKGWPTSMAELWATTDVLVMPSICTENSPMIISEAIVRQVPVLASDVGGIPELAQLSGLVRLVPPNDPAKLRAALNEFDPNMTAVGSPNFLNEIDYVKKLLSA